MFVVTFKQCLQHRIFAGAYRPCARISRIFILPFFTFAKGRTGIKDIFHRRRFAPAE